jgi:hypothetical protein
MSSDRTLVHDELLSLTGMTRRDDMYRYCRDLLSTKARTDIAPPADEGV